MQQNKEGSFFTGFFLGMGAGFIGHVALTSDKGKKTIENLKVKIENYRNEATKSNQDIIEFTKDKIEQFFKPTSTKPVKPTKSKQIATKKSKPTKFKGV